MWFLAAFDAVFWSCCGFVLVVLIVLGIAAGPGGAK